MMRRLLLGLIVLIVEYNVPDQAMAMESAATARKADDSYLTR
jgi:hypothetical protein